MIGGDCFWHLATTPLFITHHWEIYLDARFVLPDIRSNVLMHIKSSQKLGNSEERERRDSRHRKKHNDINNTEKLYAVQSFQKVYSLFWKQPVCKCFFSGVRYMERKKGLSQVVQGTWIIKKVSWFVGFVNNLNKREENRPGEPVDTQEHHWHWHL